jgi:predicted N-acyltransferase
MLADTGFQRTLQWPVARLIPHWNSFDDYLESMRHERKSVFKDIRRDLNRLRTSGTEIAQFTPQSTDVPRLQELADANYRKYGDEVFPYGAAFFTTLTTQLQDDAVWYGAWKNDRLIAFSLMLKSSNRAWGTYFGCDYDACSDDRTYFNLVFNRPIEDAIAAGLASLYFGRGLHSLKVRRGCESVPTYLYYRARTALGRALVGPTLRLRSRYVARKGGRMPVSGKGQAQPEKR